MNQSKLTTGVHSQQNALANLAFDLLHEFVSGGVVKRVKADATNKRQ